MLSGSQFHHVHKSTLVAENDSGAVRSQRNGLDLPAIARKVGKMRTCVEVPDAKQAILGTGYDASAIGSYSESPDAVAVALHRPLLLAAADVPDADYVV